MICNIGIVWIDQRVDLASPFGTVQRWFNSVESLSTIAAAAPLVAFWSWQARRGREPGGGVKIAIG